MHVTLMVLNADGRPTGRVFSFDRHDTFLFGRFRPGKDPIATILGFDLTMLADLGTSLPPALVAWVDRSLAVAPEARFRDARATLAAFEQI